MYDDLRKQLWSLSLYKKYFSTYRVHLGTNKASVSACIYCGLTLVLLGQWIYIIFKQVSHQTKLLRTKLCEMLSLRSTLVLEMSIFHEYNIDGNYSSN